MDQIRVLLILSLLSIYSTGCNVAKYEKFIDNYDCGRFENYKNVGIHVRSGDRSGNVLLFISTNLSNAANQGPYMLTVNRENLAIVGSSLKLHPKDDIDTLRFQKLAIDFLSLNINRLQVDNNCNVFIGVKRNDRDELAYFPEGNKPRHYESWKHVRNNWYVE